MQPNQFPLREESPGRVAGSLTIPLKSIRIAPGFCQPHDNRTASAMPSSVSDHMPLRLFV